MTGDEQAPSSRPSSALSRTRVAEAMHEGVFACSEEASLASVARQMSEQRIHALVVSGVPTDSGEDRHTWGIVSDLDLLRAELAGTRHLTAGQIAAMEFLTVDAGETVERAAQLMTEHEVTHLVVVDPQTGHAAGVVSTHDIARVIASENG
jgi:CBS domain-containing protein